jgi:hypothetical protein
MVLWCRDNLSDGIDSHRQFLLCNLRVLEASNVDFHLDPELIDPRGTLV